MALHKSATAKKATLVVRRAKSARAQENAQTPVETEWALLERAGLTREIGFVMRMAQLAVFDDLLMRLADAKLTLTQLTTLRLIKTRPGLMQQHIGDALRIKKPNLVALIDKLEERGLVTRMNSTVDRRAYALHLTAKGDRTVDKAMKAIDEHAKAIAKIVAPSEVERSVEVLKALAVALPRKGVARDDV